MIALPHIPDTYCARYRRFESAEWIGWVANSHWFETFESQLPDLEKLFDDENVVNFYKHDRNKLAEVRWPEPSIDKLHDAPRTVVLKSYESRSALNSLRQRVRPPRAIRHWNNVWVLNQRKINTPQPILLALPKLRTTSRGLLAVETVQSHQTIREILPRNYSGTGELIIGSRRLSVSEFAQMCGKYVRQIHDRGVAHRDLSGGNILVPDEWDGTDSNLISQFVLVDINRIRVIPTHQFDINYRIQDLERLSIPESYLDDYYFAYAGDSDEIREQYTKFLKYRSRYRRIKDAKNPFKRVLLKLFTYWPRTG